MLPDKQKLLNSGFMRRLGPAVTNPALWCWSRRGVSIGVGTGIFFGFLVPVFQIPLATLAIIFLRGNLPVAATATLITNPLTMAPLFYVAYKFGSFLTDNPSNYVPSLQVFQRLDPAAWLDWILGVGQPMMLGLFVFAVTFGPLAYFLTSLLWSAHTRWRWNKRGKNRLKARIVKARSA